MDLKPKEAAELAFWRGRLAEQGVLKNDHFEFFYTSFFGLDKEFYAGKRILDLGCGPRGSLEWATRAGLRIGLDPLAAAYVELGTAEHAMKYVAGTSEQAPFGTADFDVVSSFNSLDHVDCLEAVAREVARLTAPGGLFLVICDIHEQPTTLEPSATDWSLLQHFAGFTILAELHLEYSALSSDGFGDIYESCRRRIPFDHSNPAARYGILAAALHRS